MSYGFVEVRDGSDDYLREVLGLAHRLSSRRKVVLRLEAGVRTRVESMMDDAIPEGDRSRIELVDEFDHQAAIPAVQAASFCHFQRTEMTAYLREDQVAIYSFPHRAAS